MKLMIYYLGVAEVEYDYVIEDEVKNKLQLLQNQFPTLRNQIIVIPHWKNNNDRIEVVDMTPTALPNYQSYNYVTGAAQPPVYTTPPQFTTGGIGASFGSHLMEFQGGGQNGNGAISGGSSEGGGFTATQQGSFVKT